MGFVFKTIRKEVGEISEEVCYHFEEFEDFMTFEKQEKSESEDGALCRAQEEALSNTPPTKESTPCDENLRGVTEIVEGVTEIAEGEKYRIIDDYITRHGFSIGDIVVAEEHSDENGAALCVKGYVGKYVHVSEVEKVK